MPDRACNCIRDREIDNAYTWTRETLYRFAINFRKFVWLFSRELDKLGLSFGTDLGMLPKQHKFYSSIQPLGNRQNKGISQDISDFDEVVTKRHAGAAMDAWYANAAGSAAPDRGGDGAYS